MKIATLVLNCVTAIFSVFAMIGTYIYCGYGQFVFFFTESKDPIFKIGRLVSIGEIFLALVSLVAGLLMFFCLRKNKKTIYLIGQLLLFPYNLALHIGDLATYNYYTVRQVFYTGSSFFVNAFMGIMLCIVTLIFAIISFAQCKTPNPKQTDIFKFVAMVRNIISYKG